LGEQAFRECQVATELEVAQRCHVLRVVAKTGGGCFGRVG
jgi:hypothetical protein